MADDHKARLGRGLAALLADVEADRPVSTDRRATRRVPIEFLRPNPNNPRRQFDEAELDELAESIRRKGILQPILVRAVARAADTYEIIAGERRWRAAQRAGLHDVPVMLVEATDQESLELAIIENVQRADLNPIEEAAGYHALMQQFGHTQADLAGLIGKSRPHVANMVRLLKLPEDVRTMLDAGWLTAGHARALLASDNPSALAHRIVEQGLTVRDIERLMKAPADAPPETRTARRAAPVDPDARALEKTLSDALGLRVTIRAKAGEAGELVVTYSTFEQLDGVAQRLQG